MRILMMTAITALTIGTVADARPTRNQRAAPQSDAVKELNRKSLEQASAAPMAAPMAQPATAAAPMSDAGAMAPASPSTAPMAPADAAAAPTAAAPAMTPPAAGTTPQ